MLRLALLAASMALASAFAPSQLALSRVSTRGIFPCLLNVCSEFNLVASLHVTKLSFVYHVISFSQGFLSLVHIPRSFLPLTLVRIFRFSFLDCPR